MDENGTFLGYLEFCEKYNIRVNYLDYMGCIRTIKSYSMKHLIEITRKAYLEKPKALTVLLQLNKGAKECYKIMLEKIFIYDIRAFVKWEEKLRTVIDWEITAKHVGKIKEVKLKWFQIRLCHSILVTNSILKKMGITHNDRCTFCGNEKDTIQHYLWNCVFSQYFWHSLEKYVKEKCLHCSKLSFNVELILFGHDDKTKTDDTFDQILLLAKHFIYRCRINLVKPRLDHFLNDLKMTWKAERYSYSLDMKYNVFVKKWSSYQNLISD